MGVGEGVRKNGEKEGEKPPNTHANKNKVQTNATTIAAVALWVGKITKPKISNQICGATNKRPKTEKTYTPWKRGGGAWQVSCLAVNFFTHCLSVKETNATMQQLRGVSGVLFPQFVAAIINMREHACSVGF